MKINISDMEIGSVGKFKNNVKFKVTDRFPEDRSSGGTEIEYLDVGLKGTREWFYWDHHDPIVEIIKDNE